MPLRPLLRCALLLALAAGLVYGANALWILVDDAFITFRYVANARDGHGLVWNPPPFLPVEGYTSFAWELVLWAAWSWFGCEPPVAANRLSIGCGLITLAVLATAAFRLRHRDGRPVHDLVAAAALLLVVGNRTFLQWLTGGLDTALFNACLLGWIVLACRGPARRGGHWLTVWSAAAALVAVTRPDGLVVAAATVAVAGAAAWRGERTLRATLGGLTPLLAVVAHQTWRLWFYGEWLPNTWHAKVGAPWPEAGLHYLACFVIEHGVVVWLVLAGSWLVAELLRGPAACRRALAAHVPGVAAVAVVLFHVGYYTLRVGGDHFDYRMVSHLLAPLFLSAAAMAARLCRGTGSTLAWLACLGLASAFGWVHLAATEFRIPPQYDALSRHVPAWARPVARCYDRHRAWLQSHFICVRFLHGQDLAGVLTTLPPRRRGDFSAHDIPVATFRAVGMVSWVLPDVAILDEFGLNDWVIARHKPGNAGAAVGAVLQAALGQADRDGDTVTTRDELLAALGAAPGQDTTSAEAFTELLLLLFADTAEDRLTAAEAARIGPWCAGLRLMLHECAPPPGYLEAFRPNVTLAGRDVVVHPRPTPLTADEVRRLEATWRQRMRPQ